MKIESKTDFTKFPRAGAVARAGEKTDAPIHGEAELAHDERHLRRRAIALRDGSRVLVDLPEPVALVSGDRLLLDDGSAVVIVAAPEELLDIRARDAVHLAELAWHIGNRHLAAAIDATRILILRDHVIHDMLEGLGATVTEVVEPFEPLRGAYSGHGHGHDHGERDAYGRAPGDPHYGHNHGPDEHHGHHHDHDHHHGRGHGHHHGHGERDAYGRLPGDPHYGHDHG